MELNSGDVPSKLNSHTTKVPTKILQAIADASWYVSNARLRVKEKGSIVLRKLIFQQEVGEYTTE